MPEASRRRGGGTGGAGRAAGTSGGAADRGGPREGEARGGHAEEGPFPGAGTWNGGRGRMRISVTTVVGGLLLGMVLMMQAPGAAAIYFDLQFQSKCFLQDLEMGDASAIEFATDRKSTPGVGVAIDLQVGGSPPRTSK